MKKELLCLSLSLFTFLGTAQEQNFEWASMIDASSSSTTPYDIVVNADKDVFFFNQYGTATENDDEYVTFLGEEAKGAPYSGTSSNSNILITKSNAAGEAAWSVHSEGGDISCSESAIVPTSDGGFFLVAKVRHTNSNAAGDDVVLRLVSASGMETELTHTIDNSEWADGAYHWAYSGAMVKVDASGEIEWTKQMDMDVSAMPDATTYSYGTIDAVKFCGAEQDADGNFYIAGHLRKTMTFEDGNTVVPHNITGWDGASATNAGSSFIVKLDSNGNYLAQATTEAPDGELTYDDVKAISMVNGVLYVAGNVSGGDDAKTMTWGNDLAIVPNDDASIYMAAFNTDLEAQWVNYYPVGIGNNAAVGYTQQHGMTVTEDKIYLTMGLDGSILNPDNQDEVLIQHNNALLAAAMIVCNTEDGTLDSAVLVSSATSVAGAFEAVVSEDEVFVFYYDWAASPKIAANTYDKTTLELTNTYPVMTSTGMATVWTAAGVDDKILFAVRDNKDMSFEGTDLTFSPSGYEGAIVTYSFTGQNFVQVSKGESSDDGDVDGVEQATNATSGIYGVQGGVVVRATEAQAVAIYSIMGSSVYNATVAEGDTFVSLPQGIYIANNKKVVVY